MKNEIKAGLIACLLSLAFLTVDAQLTVRIRPSRPAIVVKRTPAPARGHVWVDEDWTPQNDTYKWHGGYWSAPPRTHAIYVKGHWMHSRKGDVWIAGRWR